MKHTPTERLILLSLQLRPDQTVAELCAAAGITHSYHLTAALRILLAERLVVEDATTKPKTYRLTEVKHV